jgi:hypothetical protein
VTPGAIFADAQLASIANNGGLTETLALSATSPAVDAGTSTNAPPVDQRGRPRVGAVDVVRTSTPVMACLPMVLNEGEEHSGRVREGSEQWLLVSRNLLVVPLWPA